MSDRASKNREAEEALRIVSDFLQEARLDSPVHLHEPLIDEGIRETIAGTLASGFVSSVGPTVARFESALASFCGTEFAVCTSSGTSALQLALKIHDVQPGDHVAVPALSFIATANAVTFLGAVPVFLDSVDIDLDTSMGLSAYSLELLLRSYVKTDGKPVHRHSGAALACIIPMHTLGRLVDLEEIQKIATEWNLPIIEDAAEALGSFDRSGLHSGATNTAVLSFNGNKIITTGGGGAVVTNSADLAAKAKHLSTTAKVPHSWAYSHDEVGWNFRMPAINAALGLGQLNSMKRILMAKDELLARYRNAFFASEFFEIVENPTNQKSNNWLIAIRLKKPDTDTLHSVLDALHQEGFLCRPLWDLLPTQPPYSTNFSTPTPNAEKLRGSVICLPSSPGLAT